MEVFYAYKNGILYIRCDDGDTKMFDNFGREVPGTSVLDVSMHWNSCDFISVLESGIGVSEVLYNGYVCKCFKEPLSLVQMLRVLQGRIGSINRVLWKDSYGEFFQYILIYKKKSLMNRDLIKVVGEDILWKPLNRDN